MPSVESFLQVFACYDFRDEPTIRKHHTAIFVLSTEAVTNVLIADLALADLMVWVIAKEAIEVRWCESARL
jgi:hypothetical protein